MQACWCTRAPTQPSTPTAVRTKRRNAVSTLAHEESVRLKPRFAHSSSRSRPRHACSRLPSSIPASVQLAGPVFGAGRSVRRSCCTCDAATCCTKWHSERSGSKNSCGPLPSGGFALLIEIVKLCSTVALLAAARRRRQTSATCRWGAAFLRHGWVTWAAASSVGGQLAPQTECCPLQLPATYNGLHAKHAPDVPWGHVCEA